LWLWRHNPLRRATDLVESWLAFLALLLIALAAPVVGWLSGSLTHGELRQTVREQQEQRYEVTAMVVRRTAQMPVDSDSETTAERDAVRMVVASWKAPDGSRHTGPVNVRLQQADPGERIRIWTDRGGQVVSRPMGSATAATHAALAGFGAFAAAAGLVEGGRRLVVWHLMRRRYEAWDREWARSGPDWGRTGAGS
jgi:hypothetical protein